MSGGPRREDMPLAAIYGVGEKKAESLEDAGYMSAIDVAEADAEEMAAEAELVQDVDEAEDFIVGAQSMLSYWPDE